MEKDRCSYCGTTFKSIKESGLVGCEHCYSEIEPLISIVDRLFEGKVFHGRPPARRQHDEF